MDIKPKEILEAVKGAPPDGFTGDLPVNRIWTDTRTLEKDDVFVALKGPRFDGHDFLKQAFERGARMAIVSDAKAAPADLKKAMTIILVADTLAAYGELARLWRARFKIPLVAVTGSVGKTTVKELVACVLSAKRRVLKNKGTENNLIGVPKTLLGLESSHEAAVLELGTNRPGEIARLGEIAAPNFGILTQVGYSHLEGLENIEGVKTEKLSLLKTVEKGGIVAVNGEDPNLSAVQSGVHKVVRVGFSRDTADLWAEQIWCHENGTSFYVPSLGRNNGSQKTLFETSLIGRHNILNCLFAILAGTVLEIELAAIQKTIASFRPLPGRLCLRKLDEIIFIDDSYNANPTSFKAALDTLKEFKIREKKGVVMGDMLELGAESERCHRELGAYAAELLFDFVIAVGHEARHAAGEAARRGMSSKKIHRAKDSREAGKILQRLVAPGDMVLVKGSRGMQMERIFDCFTTSSIP